MRLKVRPVIPDGTPLAVKPRVVAFRLKGDCIVSTTPVNFGEWAGAWTDIAGLELLRGDERVLVVPLEQGFQIAPGDSIRLGRGQVSLTIFDQPCPSFDLSNVPILRLPSMTFAVKEPME